MEVTSVFYATSSLNMHTSTFELSPKMHPGHTSPRRRESVLRMSRVNTARRVECMFRLSKEFQPFLARVPEERTAGTGYQRCKTEPVPMQGVALSRAHPLNSPPPPPQDLCRESTSSRERGLSHEMRGAFRWRDTTHPSNACSIKLRRR